MDEQGGGAGPQLRHRVVPVEARQLFPDLVVLFGLVGQGQHLAALAGLGQHRRIRLRPAVQLGRELERQELDRQHLGQRRLVVARRAMLPAGDVDQPAALADELLDPVHVLLAEEAGRHVAEDDQVVRRTAPAGVAGKLGRNGGPALATFGVGLHQQELGLDAAVAEQAVLQELVLPARRVLDDQHLDLAIDDADRPFHLVVGREGLGALELMLATRSSRCSADRRPSRA